MANTLGTTMEEKQTIYAEPKIKTININDIIDEVRKESYSKAKTDLLNALIEREKDIIEKYPKIDENSNNFLIIGNKHFILAKTDTINYLKSFLGE